MGEGGGLNYVIYAKMVNYNTYLQGNYWKERRKIFRNKTWNRCYICHSKKELQTHHKRYIRNNISILFNEKHSDLRLLCKICHFKLHKYKLEYMLIGNKIKRRWLRDYLKKLK